LRSAGRFCLRLGKMGEADLPFFTLAVVGNEEEIVGLPSRPVSAIAEARFLRTTRLNTRRSAPRQPLGLELYEKMPQGCPADKGGVA